MKLTFGGHQIVLHPFLWDVLVIGLSIVAGLILKLFLHLVLNYYKKRSDYSFFKSLLIHMGPRLNFFIPLLVLNLAFPAMMFGARTAPVAERVLEIALIISFAALVIGLVRVMEDYVYHKYDLNKADNLKERKVRTQLQFIRKILVIVIVLLTVSIILLSFDNVRKIGAGMLTGVGIGGIIIGFAAQKSLGNLLAGLQIAFTQPIRIDDVLVVENEWGRVEDITLTYVVLRIWDQRRMILPITYFIEKPFQNWTRISAEIIGTVFLYMDYTIPIEKLRTEFDRLMDTTPLWDKRVKVLQVTDAKEHTIELRALMSSANSSDNFDLRCFIREQLISFIQQQFPDALPKTRVSLGSRDRELRRERTGDTASQDQRSPEV